jgi:hypothetical protein
LIQLDQPDHLGPDWIKAVKKEMQRCGHLD